MVLEILAAKRQGRKDEWENGDILLFGKDEHMLRNAAAIGECNGFKFVMEMAQDLDKLKGEVDAIVEE